MKHNCFIIAATLGTALLVSACATSSTSVPSEEESRPFSGFLSDYSKLKPAPDGSGALTWRDPAKLAQYDKLLLERIKVSLKDDTAYKTIDPTELKALVDYFHEALSRELGGAYPMVSTPGPGVLRVRIAVTNLVPTKPEMSVVALVVPYATVADMGSGAATGQGAGSPTYVGETGIEAEFLDSQTSRVVGQYVDKQIGKKYVVDTSEGIGQAVTKGFSQYGKAYTTWGYAKQAFDYWAKLFRQRFDELQGRPPASG